jgi:hypothetical protein
MAAKLKLKTHLHRKDIRGINTYLVIRDASKIFGTLDSISVEGTLDEWPIEGTLHPKADGSHWLNVKKEWREAIGKTIGESVEIILQHKQTNTANAANQKITERKDRSIK